MVYNNLSMYLYFTSLPSHQASACSYHSPGHSLSQVRQLICPERSAIISFPHCNRQHPPIKSLKRPPQAPCGHPLHTTNEDQITNIWSVSEPRNSTQDFFWVQTSTRDTHPWRPFLTFDHLCLCRLVLLPLLHQPSQPPCLTQA